MWEQTRLSPWMVKKQSCRNESNTLICWSWKSEMRRRLAVYIEGEGCWGCITLRGTPDTCTGRLSVGSVPYRWSAG
jgi:hypothetical protein